MRTVGFAIVIDHGVDANLQVRVREKSKEWFTGTSATHHEQRNQFKSPKYGLPGFSPLGAEAVGRPLGALGDGDQNLSTQSAPQGVADDNNIGQQVGELNQQQELDKLSSEVDITNSETIDESSSAIEINNSAIESNSASANNSASEISSASSNNSANANKSATGSIDQNTDASTNRSMSDLVESLYIITQDQALPPSLEVDLRKYWSEMIRLLHQLMEISAQALNVDKNFFEQPFEFPECALRCAHYPALDSFRASDVAGRERYGSHTDYMGFTILGVDGEPGLQVLVDGVWVDVPYVETGLIVNAGDFLPIYTNGLWRSNVHRVLAPAVDSDAARRSRFSTVFFTGPSEDSIVEPIDTCVSDERPKAFEAVRSGDWLEMRLAAGQSERDKSNN